MSGGGCLAHEWLHGLDNLLLESQGGDAKADDFLTEDPSLLPPGVPCAMPSRGYRMPSRRVSIALSSA